MYSKLQPEPEPEPEPQSEVWSPGNGSNPAARLSMTQEQEDWLSAAAETDPALNSCMVFPALKKPTPVRVQLIGHL